MIRVIRNRNIVLNFDNNTDTERYLKANPNAVELSQEDVKKIFKGKENHASAHTVEVDGEELVFSFKETDKLLEQTVRSKRDYLLSKSDWRYLVNNTKYRTEEWDRYRKALRDLTDQPGFPNSVEWPTEPSAE